VILADHRLEWLQQVAFQPDLLKGQDPRRLVEQPQHHPFAKGRGQSRDADIHVAATHPHPETAILRQPFFGDIQLGHDLDAGDYPGVGLECRPENFVQDSVDPVTDNQFPLEGLDMDIARPFLETLGDQAVDEADDRSLVGTVKQIAGFERNGQLIGAAAIDLLNHGSGTAGLFFIATMDGAQDLLRGGDTGFDLGSGQGAQVIQRTGVEGIGHGHLKRVILFCQGINTVFLGKADGDHPEQTLGNRFLGNRLQIRKFELDSQCLCQCRAVCIMGFFSHGVTVIRCPIGLTSAGPAPELRCRARRCSPLLPHLRSGRNRPLPSHQKNYPAVPR